MLVFIARKSKSNLVVCYKSNSKKQKQYLLILCGSLEPFRHFSLIVPEESLGRPGAEISRDSPAALRYSEFLKKRTQYAANI